MLHARLLALALAGALALGAAACGDDDEEDSGTVAAPTTAETTTTDETTTAETTTTAGGGRVETVRISGTEFAFDPANPTIARPGTVRFAFSNDGQAPHALEVEGPEGEVETAVLQPGERENLEVELSKPGSYELYCPVGNHRDQGMEGEVVVDG